jgi:hypothetical protein
MRRSWAPVNALRWAGPVLHRAWGAAADYGKMTFNALGKAFDWPSSLPDSKRTLIIHHCYMIPTTPFWFVCKAYRIGVVIKPLGSLVPVSSTSCDAYTAGLSTRWSTWTLQSRLRGMGELILGGAWRLDAFSAYLFRA